MSDEIELADFIELVPVDDIEPYPGNAKEHPEKQIIKIAESIRAYGWDVPIVVDQNNEIVKGHGRLIAAKRIGLKEVPVIKRDLSRSEAKAARLADNKTAESEWDEELLKEELEDILYTDADLPTGFDDDEIENLLSDDDPFDDTQGNLKEDFIVPPFSVLDTRQGYWQDRKRAWKDWGLESWKGRSEELTYNTEDTIIAMGEKDTSIFDPVLTELIYRWFTPHDDARIVDPFAGGSVRGLVAERLGYTYTGIDLSQAQIDANRENAENLGLEPEWIVDNGLHIKDHVDEESADLIISCPPYHDLEQYTDDPNDLSNMTYREFLDTYRKIIQRTADTLKPNRFAVFVVGEVRHDLKELRGFVPDTINAFRDAGLHLYNEMILVNVAGTLPLRVRNQFENSRKIGKHHQNVLVFYKGDPGTIPDTYPDDVEIGEETPRSENNEEIL